MPKGLVDISITLMGFRIYRLRDEYEDSGFKLSSANPL